MNYRMKYMDFNKNCLRFNFIKSYLQMDSRQHVSMSNIQQQQQQMRVHETIFFFVSFSFNFIHCQCVNERQYDKRNTNYHYCFD